MSSITSSIWHTKKEKPTEDKTIFAQHKSFRDGCIDCFLWEKQEFTEAIRKDVIAWTYLDNLLVCEQELIRTRKELDIRKKQVEIANKAFDFIDTEWDNVDCSRKELGACAFNAKEDIAGWESDIKTAEQKDVK